MFIEFLILRLNIVNWVREFRNVFIGREECICFLKDRKVDIGKELRCRMSKIVVVEKYKMCLW